MKVAVTGGTGFVGGKLVEALLDRGDEVRIVSRSSGPAARQVPAVTRISWDTLAESPDQLNGVDAIVNLAGESINQRWTEAAKVDILQSRLDAAERLQRALESPGVSPRVVVNASAIAAYGSSRDGEFDESSPLHANDFLSSVVGKWEEAADRIGAARLVKVRTGVVLDNEGGAFPKMAMPYRLFAGGRVGSGRQWLSWIHIEDMIRLLLFCIDNPDIRGPINACAPDPVTNDRFGRALGASLHRPHWFPVPAFMMKAIFGELSVMLLEGQKALPRKALDYGFQFRYPTVDSAMKALAADRRD